MLSLFFELSKSSWNQDLQKPASQCLGPTKTWWEAKRLKEHFSKGPLEAFSWKHYSARIWSHLKPNHHTKPRFVPSLAGWLVANAQPTFMLYRLVTQYLFGQIGQIHRLLISPTFNFTDFQFCRTLLIFLHIRTKRLFCRIASFLLAAERDSEISCQRFWKKNPMLHVTTTGLFAGFSCFKLHEWYQ